MPETDAACTGTATLTSAVLCIKPLRRLGSCCKKGKNNQLKAKMVATSIRLKHNFLDFKWTDVLSSRVEILYFS